MTMNEHLDGYGGPPGTHSRTWEAREQALVERAPRIVRLLFWLTSLAAAGLAVWTLIAFLSPPAHAGDAREAAEAIGRAGTVAAAAIVQDGSSASRIPGFAGTDLPEGGLTDATMEDTARRVLLDQEGPGGAAGRAVIEGAASRPEAEVPASDPLVRQSARIADDPKDTRWRADGIASGRAEDCTASQGDIDKGGSCGRIVSCTGAGCETVETEANTGFTRSAAMLNMVLEMGGDEFDREALRFFAGERKACRIRLGGLANCCKNSGLLNRHLRLHARGVRARTRAPSR